MRLRDLFTWKTYFYEGLLPALRRLGPGKADAALGALGRLSAVWPPKRRALAAALARARTALGAEWDERAAVPALAAGSLRFVARDYLLDTPDDAAALARFDVSGGECIDEALAAGRGLILVGGHFGGHLAALHWFYRRALPLRVMVQRPKHVSKALGAFFDVEGPDPQSAYFLRRGLGPADCVARMLRVRSAVRSGKPVYFAGDIPWTGPNTRAGRLLCQPHRFLSVWADLSSLTGAPVVFTFCTHKPGGKFGLRFEPLGVVARGEEDAAVGRFLGRLEAAVAASPGEAAAHLLWPCYGPPARAAEAAVRPSRRAAVAS